MQFSCRRVGVGSVAHGSTIYAKDLARLSSAGQRIPKAGCRDQVWRHLTKYVLYSLLSKTKDSDVNPRILQYCVSFMWRFQQLWKARREPALKGTTHATQPCASAFAPCTHAFQSLRTQNSDKKIHFLQPQETRSHEVVSPDLLCFCQHTWYNQPEKKKKWGHK